MTETALTSVQVSRHFDVPPERVDQAIGRVHVSARPGRLGSFQEDRAGREVQALGFGDRDLRVRLLGEHVEIGAERHLHRRKLDQLRRRYLDKRR